MKKKISALLMALTLSASLLSGCSSGTSNEQPPNDDVNSQLLQAIVDLTNEVSELRGQLTLNPGALTAESKSISDEEGAEIIRLIDEAATKAAASPSGTKVKARDWSKYGSTAAKERLTNAEAAFYDRLDDMCKDYINNPANRIITFTLKDGTKFNAAGRAKYSDLGLNKTQAENILLWFYHNNPQYYFLSNGRQAYDSQNIYPGFMDFVEEMPDEAKVTNEMFDKLDSWIAECCDNETTTLEKVLAANKKICESIIYDPITAKYGENPDGAPYQTMYSVLMGTETVCAGYAKTFSAMTNAMGMDTCVVISKAHAWNAMRFDDGNFYFVDVCWNDNSTNPVGFKEYYIGFGTDNADKQHHVYEEKYVSWAPNIQKNNYSNKDNSAGINGTLAAPTNFTVKTTDDGNAACSWDGVNGAEGYEIQISSDANFASIAGPYNYKPNERPVFVITKDVLWYYRIRTVKGSEYSDWVTVSYTLKSDAAASPKPALAAPTNFTMKTTDSGKVSCSWDGVKGAEGYEIQVSFDANFASIASTDNYKPNVRPNFVVTKDVPYYYRIRAVKGSEYSDWVTTSYTLKSDAAASPKPALAAPTNFTMKTTDSGKVSCSWDDVKGAEGYEIQVSFDANFASIASTDNYKPNVRPNFVVTKDVPYYYRIRAVKGSEYSDWVTTSYTLKSDAVASALAAPTNFTMKTTDDGNVTCSWDKVKDAEGYEIQISFDADFASIAGTYNYKPNERPVFVVTKNVLYYYRIRAVKGSEYSDWVTTSYTLS